MLHKKIRSFGYALKGLRVAWCEEQNFRIQASLALIAIFCGAAFHISLTEWLFIVGWIAVVLSAEVFNTALEELCDMLRTSHDPHVEKIKDLGAAGAFLASCGAFVAGCVIFLPHFLALL